MKNFRLFVLLFSLFPFFLMSCASSSSHSSKWLPVSNLSDLYGTWVSSRGEYAYPLEAGGKKYLRLSYPQSDDTLKWQKFAEKHHLDLSDLWEKRFALAENIYADSENPKNLEIFPYSDENGIQKGRKFFIVDERIYSKIEILIPERILLANLGFFVIRKDTKSLREFGIFHLASDKFPDIKASDAVYFNLSGENAL